MHYIVLSTFELYRESCEQKLIPPPNFRHVCPIELIQQNEAEESSEVNDNPDVPPSVRDLIADWATQIVV